jgi:glycosidase
MDITARWMDPNGDGIPADGVDGWRLDVAEEVPLNFWKAWNARVRQLNPQAYTVAEIWNDARTYLVGGGFSATMNYHAFAFPAKGFLVDGRLSAHDFGRELLVRRQEYPPAMQFVLQNLVDSHDTDRIASMLVNDSGDEPYRNPDRFDYDESGLVSPRQNPGYNIRKPTDDERRLQRLVVLLQMTYLGAPMIYYGDEAGMWGGDDPCCRKPMVWDDLQYDVEASDPLGRPRQGDEVSVDDQLIEFYRSAIALRRKHDPLRRGSCADIASDDGAQFVVFQRELDGQRMFVAFNRGDSDYTWPLATEATRPAAAGSWDVVFATEDGAEVRKAPDGGQPMLYLPARTGAVIAERQP